MDSLIEKLQACVDDPVWPHHVEVPKKLISMTIDALQKEAEWRKVVDDELVSLHMVATDNPRESIHKLIDWHTTIQLDPRVSSAALNLYKEGFADGEAHCKEQAIMLIEQKVKDLVTLLKLEL